ncbi:MAG: hypothetical protein ACR2PL_06405 [Dehalococcoidia bacterium]
MTRAITANHWTAGPDKEFFVYTGLDIQSCEKPVGTAHNGCSYTQYCAYHSAFNFSLTLTGSVTYTLWANMPDAWSSRPNGFSPECGAQNRSGGPYRPNGDAGADGVINTTSHELFETITDPVSYSLDRGVTFVGGWYDSNGMGEIGDKCAFMYGSLASNQSNIRLNDNPYVVQQEWSNLTFTAGDHRANSGCVLSLSAPEKIRGDVNGDGHVDAVDALCVLRSVARLAETSICPALTNPIGEVLE